MKQEQQTAFYGLLLSAMLVFHRSQNYAVMSNSYGTIRPEVIQKLHGQN